MTKKAPRSSGAISSFGAKLNKKIVKANVLTKKYVIIFFFFIQPEEITYKSKLNFSKISQTLLQFLICSYFSLRIYLQALDLKKELQNLKLSQRKQGYLQFG